MSTDELLHEAKSEMALTDASVDFLERQGAGWDRVALLNEEQRTAVFGQQIALLGGTQQVAVRHEPSWQFYSHDKPHEDPYEHAAYYNVFSVGGRDMDVVRLCYGYFRKKLLCTIEVLQNANNREQNEFPKGNDRNALVVDHCIRSARDMLKAGWNLALIDHPRPRYKAVRDRYFTEKSKYYYMHYFPHTDSSLSRRTFREWKEPNRFCTLNPARARVQALLGETQT